MNSTINKLFLIFLIFALTATLRAQVGYGGKPLYIPESLVKKPVAAVTMPSLPYRSADSTAAAAKYKQGEPLQFAHSFNVNLTPDNSGEWSTENGMMIWRLRIYSEGATSISITFDRYVMPPNASLFVFNPACSMVLGAFTSENNKATGILPISPVQGDEAIVELQLREPFSQMPELKIGAVHHGYLDIFTRNGNFGDSDDCHTEASCNPRFEQQRRSVARLIVSNQLCSGALVNNTANDGTPYFLTAAHCIKNESDAARAIFLFNYDAPKCEATIEGYKNQSVSGSYLRAFVKEMDFALLEIDEAIPADYRPYWSGWSRTAQLAVSAENPAAAIHHPSGDVKKITYSESAPKVESFTVQGQTFTSNAHWQIARWSSGATEGGSSGCPLFCNGYIIGGLSGGSSNCTNPRNDYFFRLNRAWKEFPNEPEKQLACWLDPLNTDVTECDGIDFNNSEFVRLSNLAESDSASMVVVNTGSGTWSGHNSLPTERIAEQFSQIKTAQIHGIYLMTAKSRIASNQTIDINIRTGASPSANLIASKENISIRQLAANKENLVMLDDSITATGVVWVELVLKYNASRVDTFAVFQSKPSALHKKNTAWLKNSGDEWTSFDAISGNGKASFWIDILAKNVELSDSAYLPPVPLPFAVYPNPATDNMTIEYGTTGAGDVDIFNLSGQCVLSKQVTIWNGKAFINIETLKAGIYILRFSSQDEIFTRRVVKL
ncbi:MAG: T9SS type A sorting domain-containing protein [Cytophagaceae bacterium]|nr:T9SS type A sorting domain-containing protein [Cytophagaceae bacterium]